MCVIKNNIPINPIILGKIGSASGVQGWLRMFSYTEKKENIFTYYPLFIKKKEFNFYEIKLEDWKKYKNYFLIKINSVKDREIAKLFVNYEIIVDASNLSVLADGDYYWKDLIDCKVVTKENYNLGKVINLIETGSHDVLVVQSNIKDIFGINERFIPFINKKIIKKVNITTRIIIVNWNPNF